ncbi:transposase [Streptomyces mesophilus]|uniref:transposase n=1 Tax=Streptomyces mesophilus TaxID=1775132 RepID=UPI003EB98465
MRYADGGGLTAAGRQRRGAVRAQAAELFEQKREWLSVFLLPAYSPDLNPVEWVWAHVKRSLANLAVVALDRLEALVRDRLKRLQYRPGTLDGFIAGTGLALDIPTSP